MLLFKFYVICWVWVVGLSMMVINNYSVNVLMLVVNWWLGFVL